MDRATTNGGFPLPPAGRAGAACVDCHHAACDGDTRVRLPRRGALARRSPGRLSSDASSRTSPTRGRRGPCDQAAMPSSLPWRPARACPRCRRSRAVGRPALARPPGRRARRGRRSWSRSGRRRRRRHLRQPAARDRRRGQHRSAVRSARAATRRRPADGRAADQRIDLPARPAARLEADHARRAARRSPRSRPGGDGRRDALDRGGPQARLRDVRGALARPAREPRRAAPASSSGTPGPRPETTLDHARAHLRSRRVPRTTRSCSARAGDYWYYLATTSQPGASAEATDGVDLVQGSFLPQGGAR